MGSCAVGSSGAGAAVVGACMPHACSMVRECERTREMWKRCGRCHSERYCGSKVYNSASAQVGFALKHMGIADADVRFLRSMGKFEHRKRCLLTINATQQLTKGPRGIPSKSARPLLSCEWEPAQAGRQRNGTPSGAYTAHVRRLRKRPPSRVLKQPQKRHRAARPMMTDQAAGDGQGPTFPHFLPPPRLAGVTPSPGGGARSKARSSRALRDGFWICASFSSNNCWRCEP